ncbi:oocyte zinc finger protein XlCOF7.1-like isoform X4 [Dendropsophus ebraccatus]|uniref:oocyte zinc finger protein XlCOF7.1-like isoform X4 n=1 Tax=Dendropsophus ebraccatus TaxID=150705 RepID=UPI0038314F4C
MVKTKTPATERILHLTLEIIYLLTGEEYTIVKKTLDECMASTSHSHVSGAWSKIESSITEPHSLSHERNNEQKILQLAKKIMELLAEEKWDYFKECKGDMVENQQANLSKDGSNIGDIPKNCSSPLYSQDCPKDNNKNPKHYQVGDLINIKVEVIEGDEETLVMNNQQYGEDTHAYISPEKKYRSEISGGQHLLSPDFGVEDTDIPGHSLEENPIILNILPLLHISNPSPEPAKEYSPDYKTDVLKHQIVNKSEKPYPCSICGKRFTDISNRSRHQKIHSGKKPFSCSECAKCFSRKSHLIEHHRIHTGEKPYSCSQCGKCFIHRSQLVIHQRAHSGGKPF